MKIREYEKMGMVDSSSVWMSLYQEQIYRILQNLFQRILKRSYNHSTSFICLKLEELELNLNAVLYLFKVLKKQRYFNTYNGIRIEYSLVRENGRSQFRPAEQSPYCLIRCGTVIYR